MVWALWYGTTILTSFVWLMGGVMGRRLSLYENLAASIPVGTIGGSWLVFFASCLVGHLNVTSVALGTSVMVFLAASHLSRCLEELSRVYAVLCASKGLASKLPLTYPDWVCLGLSLALGWVLWPLYSSRMIPEEHGMVWSGGSCYGDLPIHMQIANSFVFGCNRDVSWAGMMSPIFAGERMTYPFLPDFHAAIFPTLGGTLRHGFLYPGFLMAASLWALLYYFSLRISRSPVGAALSVLLTIGAGGLGGVRWVAHDGWATAMANDVVQHDYTGEWKHLWFAFIPHILLPQRGGNFAYPLVAFIFLLLWVATEQAPAAHPVMPHLLPGRPRALTLWSRGTLLRYTALFAGMLPLVQAHAFIGVGVVVGVVAVLDAHKWVGEPALAGGWASAGAIALALGGPQMALFRRTVSQGFYGSFMTIGWIFMKDLYKGDEGNPGFGIPHNAFGFLRFWWHSLGSTVPLFLGALVAYGLESGVALRQARRLCTGGEGRLLSYLRGAQEDSVIEWAESWGVGHTGSSRAESDVCAQLTRGGGEDSDSPPGRGSASSALLLGGTGKFKSTPRRGEGGGGVGGGGSGSGAPSVGGVGGGGGGGTPRVSGGGFPSTPKSASRGQLSGSSSGSHLQQHSSWEDNGGGGGGGGADGNGGGGGVGGDSTPSFHTLGLSSHSSQQGPPRGGFGIRSRWESTLMSLTYTVIYKFPWLRALDRRLSPANTLSVAGGRALDTLKFCLAGAAVFLLGNYVNFQPWDRDNAKLYYIFIFISSAVNGGLLAAPLEALLGCGPGRARIHVWCTLTPPSSTHLPSPSAAAALGSTKSGGGGHRLQQQFEGGGGEGDSLGGGAPLLHLRPQQSSGSMGEGDGGGGVGGEDDSPLSSDSSTPNMASYLAPIHSPRMTRNGGGGGGGSGLGLTSPLRHSDGSDPSLSSSSASASSSSSSIRTAGERTPTRRGGSSTAGRGGGGGGGDGGGRWETGSSGSGDGSGVGGNHEGPSSIRQRATVASPSSSMYPHSSRPALQPPSSPSKFKRSGGSLPLTVPMAGFSLVCTVASPFLFLLATLSGFMLLMQEERHWSPMFDRDAISVGDFIKSSTHPTDVIMHSNQHVQPSASLAARPSLVAYFGWVSNHGYNANERLGDRDVVIRDLLQDDNENTVFLLHKWGIRYVVTENAIVHDRPKEREWREAQYRASKGEIREDEVPEFDKDVYLGGAVSRVYKQGRFDVFRVN